MSLQIYNLCNWFIQLLYVYFKPNIIQLVEQTILRKIDTISILKLQSSKRNEMWKNIPKKSGLGKLDNIKTESNII